MAAYLDPIWETYRQHHNLDLLRDEILTYPWYETPQKADESLLLRAIQTRDAGAAQLLMSMGESFLHAALMDQPQMVRFLLDAGANRAAMSRDSLMFPPMRLRELLKTRNVTHADEILEMLNH